ncbi:MAG TPA: PAS domain S-box protein, partial [Methanobacterium sp.]|nr:PAS domain S-box protein [Methanobacterium sp.]
MVGGITLAETDTMLRELFLKSPIGVLFYNKKGKLIAANQSAKDIMGIPEFEGINLNLFNNHDIASKKEKLIDKGKVQVQSKINFENIRKEGYYNPTRSGTAYLNFIISTIDSGYLVQVQDITNKLYSENSMKESYYRTIFENTGMAFMIFDEDNTISLANTEAEKILGYSKDELQGKKKWTEFIAKKDDLKRMEEYHKLRMKNKDISPKKYEFQIIDKQGIAKSIITTVSMIPGTKKSIASFLNITKLKIAEQKLQKNEAKYRELVENANSIILKMDKKGHITFLNEFAEKFFGFNKEEVMGESVIGTVVPETESSGRNLQKVINMLIKDPEAYINTENENMTREGKRVWVAWTNKGIYNTKGEVTGVLSIGTDISKRKHAEEELQKAHTNLELKVQKRTKELNESNDSLKKEIQERKHVEEALIKSRNYLDKIINSIADPVFVKDKQHRWVLVNDAYCNFIGYSREELLEKSDYDFLPQHEADIFWEKDEEVLKTGVENVNEEEFTDSDGNLHVIVTKKTVYTDISGEQYIVAIIRDITERKKAEDKLRRSERKLKLAMDMAKLAYWEYDVSSDMFTFDDRFYKLYGTTAGKVGGSKMSSEKYARKFVSPEESYMVKEEIEKALGTDNPDFFKQVEHSIIKSDGEKRFITVRYGVIKDAEGRTVKTYGVNQDITELKKAEEALKDSEVKFRGIFDNATDMISLIES